MKGRWVLIGLLFLVLGCSQNIKSTDTRSLLLKQLQNTHTEEGWFAPLHTAIEGINKEQSDWKANKEDHSIAELVSHLIFWNEAELAACQGNVLPEFNSDNEVTFSYSSSNNWKDNIKKLDSIQTQWESVIENASEEQLDEWGPTILNICSHNAYHTGQIVYIRKLNGWWD